jgi:hypothetical protein
MKPAKPYGIRTLNDIRDRCRVVDGHWIWVGAVSKGQARVWAPDITNGGEMRSQPGPRAVWHAKTGEPIPKGMRVFCNCSEPRCINPEHIVCRTPEEQGGHVAASGKLKGLLTKIVANRKINQKRSKVTPEALDLILYSDLTGQEVSAETGICRSTISRIRRGESGIVSNPFAGLGARP